MSFSDILNKYIKIIGCSAKELALASNLSKATISRYCNNTRIPANNSSQFNSLVLGLVSLAQAKKIPNVNKKEIMLAFNKVLKNYDLETIIENFNHLINELKINVSEFSKMFGFDASHISKIRSGKRKLADPEMFLEAISNYISINYSEELISSLINCSITELKTDERCKELLILWLLKKHVDNTNINNFLTKLDDFDLNEYIRVINFDKLKVPTIPFKIPKSKHYYGIEEMKHGEIDFLKSTILSKSKGDVFMCSDMQMDDMANDVEFGKKWMFGIAMMIKKGLHLNVIHNLDRPFNEMMIGLESWIPIYMTGQVSPYYLPKNENSSYEHLNNVSSDIALTGECIKGYHSKGKYYLTNNKSEVNYYQEKVSCLLKKAKPLMKMYKDYNIDNLNRFLDNDVNTLGNRKIISSALPIYTIPDKLLDSILKRNKISNKNEVIKFVNIQKDRINTILKENKITEIITEISKEEFNKYPLSLELSGMFYNKKIIYTYDEYIEHYQATLNFKNDNFLLSLNNNAFRNIQIHIHENKWVMISKTNNPTIHFVIEHPKLREAIENLEITTDEKK